MASESQVALAYLHSYTVTSIFMDSVCHAFEYERESGKNRLSGVHSMAAGAMVLDQARNDLVKGFLERSDSEWLWMVDTDIGFAPDALDRLLSAAAEHDVRILGGLYFGLWGAEYNGHGGFVHTEVRPQIFQWSSDEQAYRQLTNKDEIPEDSLLMVDGTGTGCLLMHRTALEEIGVANGESWFDLILPVPGSRARISEDLSFCLRARSLDLQIGVHTGVRVSHQKPTWI